MTLKERFKQWLDTDPRVQIREVQLEVIADDFAIEFAKYVLINHGKYKFVNLEKMLYLFKKEKGL